MKNSAELQRLGAPKTSIRYTKKRAPKINSDICFAKIL